jgi:hypothetical protein
MLGTIKYVVTLVCTILLIHLTQESKAQPAKVGNSYQVVESLEDQWLIYDEAYNGYVPYLPEKYAVPRTISLSLDLDKNRFYSLQVQTTQPAYLFIQSRLCAEVPANSSLILQIDSLKKLYATNHILLTLYNEGGHISLPAAFIIYKQTQLLAREALQKNELPLKVREGAAFRDFVVFVSIIILAFYAFLWNYYPKAFSRYYGFKYLFSTSFREDVALINKPLNYVNLLFLFIHSLVLSFFYVLLQKGSDRITSNLINIDYTNTFSGLLFYFFSIAILLFVLLIGKYILLYVIGNLFRLTEVIQIHYYEYLLFSKVFYTFIVPVQILVFLNAPHLISWIFNGLIMLVIVFNIARIFVINSVLNKLVTFRNLYLFSYLCATELVPLLMGIKLLAK